MATIQTGPLLSARVHADKFEHHLGRFRENPLAQHLPFFPDGASATGVRNGR